MKRFKPVFIVLCVLSVIIATIDESIPDKKEQESKLAVETETQIHEEEQNIKESKGTDNDEQQAKKKAKKEEEQAKKKAKQQAKKEAEEQAKKKAEEQAKKKAEEQAKKEAEEQAKKETAEKKKEDDTEESEKEGFWDDAKKLVKDAADAVENGKELVQGYSFELDYNDDGYSFVSDQCEEYTSIYNDFEYEPHIFRGYAEYKMSVSTKNKICKHIKKELDSFMDEADDNEFAEVSVNEDLSKFTFSVKDYEPSDLMDEEYGYAGEIMMEIAGSTAGYEYMKEDLFEREWYNWAYLYQFFNKNGGKLVKVEFIDADTGESLYVFK